MAAVVYNSKARRARSERLKKAKRCPSCGRGVDVAAGFIVCPVCRKRALDRYYAIVRSERKAAA